jgi:EmrB/QacA subfamily drug resistance transporter
MSGGPVARVGNGAVLAAAIAGSGVVFLDATVVTVALPRIGLELSSPRFGGLEAQAYVYNAYLLSLGSLLVLAGALGDVHGRRRVYALGLAGFTAASLLCALAPTMEVLIAARVLQGVAAAAIVPGALAIITDAFEGEARARAFGLWAGASGVATIVGPVVGGVLVDVVSWRAVFVLGAPIAASGLWLTWRHVGESRAAGSAGRVDWPGSLVGAVAVGGLSLGAIRGQQQAWEDPLAWVALAAGSAATVGFVVRMTRAAEPLVPPALFRSRNFTVTNVSSVAIYGALYVTMYVVVTFLQGTLGYSAAAAGMATVPTVLFLAVFSTRVGVLAARHGQRWFLAAGPALMAVGALLLTRVRRGDAGWTLDVARPATWWPPAEYVATVLPGLVVFGLGIALVVAPLTTSLMASVPDERAGVASAVNNALARVGPQLAMAVLFVAISASFSSGLADRLEGLDASTTEARSRLAPLVAPAADVDPVVADAARDASLGAFRLAMLAAALLATVGAVVNAIGIEDAPRLTGPRRPVECLPGATPPVAAEPVDHRPAG